MPDLEERSIESMPERCQNCGTELTEAEKQRILDEATGTGLCTTCAAEAAPVIDTETEDAEDVY